MITEQKRNVPPLRIAERWFRHRRASSCIHKSGSVYRGLLTLKLPGDSPYGIRHRRFQKRQCALVSSSLLSVNALIVVRPVLCRPFFSVKSTCIKRQSKVRFLCAQHNYYSKEFAITYRIHGLFFILAPIRFARPNWLMLERHRDIISGRGLRINIPTAIPLLRLLHRKFERVSMSRAGKGLSSPHVASDSLYYDFRPAMPGREKRTFPIHFCREQPDLFHAAKMEIFTSSIAVRRRWPHG